MLLYNNNMPDYSKGQVYKIVSPCGMVYYGSTTQRIMDRMSEHISAAKRNENRTSQQVIEAGGEIYLVEMYPCNSVEELRSREGWYIKYRPCVNKYRACLTVDERIEYKKQYYQDNRDEILAKKKKKFECSCGGRYAYCDKAKHFKTNKHKRWLELCE